MDGFAADHARASGRRIEHIEHPARADENVRPDSQGKVAELHATRVQRINDHPGRRGGVEDVTDPGMPGDERLQRFFQRHVVVAVGEYGKPRPLRIAVKVETDVRSVPD